MNRAQRVTKSSALVKHRYPMAAQFVWEVYNNPGMDQFEISAAMATKYFNINKRCSKLVRRCGGLVRVDKETELYTYHRVYKELTPNMARDLVKKSKPRENLKARARKMLVEQWKLA